MFLLQLEEYCIELDDSFLCSFLLFVSVPSCRIIQKKHTVIPGSVPQRQYPSHPPTP